MKFFGDMHETIAGSFNISNMHNTAQCDVSAEIMATYPFIASVEQNEMKSAL